MGHVHTGVVEFVFAGVSAIVFIHLVRAVATHLSNTQAFGTVGKSLGGLVTFGGA